MRKKKWSLLLLFGLINFVGFSQRLDSLKKEVIESQYKRVTRLNRNQRKIDSLSPLLKDSWRVYDIDANGNLILEKLFNNEAAFSSGITAIQPGGQTGLSLTGENVEIGVWDGGRVRATHQEFGNRIEVVDGDDLSNHATHVTGTILAGGVNTAARGMAVAANAITFDFNNDNSEMLFRIEPDQSGLILSNHSYGTVAGWDINSSGNWQWYGNSSVSQEEDYKFGFYDDKARTWDQFVYEAPYYTIVKSAGNDRSDSGDGSRPADGPYDCIPTYGIAKNIITVGAVNKLDEVYTKPADVEMSTFSSWGPADDGRIKPDLVAAGVDLLSTASAGDELYTRLSGTSMSAPVVTGGLALLQELHRNETGSFMKAATLKALAIHTADEAGQPGPDYQFGWGLFNAERAADHLLNSYHQPEDTLIETSIAEGETYELELYPKKDTPLRVTLTWTDPAGTPTAISLDPSNPMLVNDLDLRLTNEVEESYMPWILDPSKPASKATKGDNVVDNVEQVVIEHAEPRKYILTVGHKGGLENGAQDFSLMITYTPQEQLTANSLYWVGGNGNWSDPSHWSATSGGPAVGRIPTINDRVVVDENSFTQNDQLITLTDSSFCSSFTWLVNTSNGLNLNQQVLVLDQNFLVSTDNFSMIQGRIYLGEKAKRLDTEGASSQQVVWEIDSKETVEVATDLKADSIIFRKGRVVFEKGNYQIANLRAEIDYAETVDFSGSTLEDIKSLQLKKGQALFTNSRLAFALNIPVLVDADSLTVNGELTINSPDYVIRGKGLYITNLFINGVGKIQSSFSVDSLSLAGDLTLSDEDTLTVNAFTFIENSTRIKSNVNAAISFDYYDRVCLEQLTVENVDKLGEAIVTVGDQSILVNAQNWLTTNCDATLLPAFDTDYPCVNGLTLFSNQSLGNYESVGWKITEDETITSLEGDTARYSFTIIGDHKIVLTISNAEDIQSLERTISIENNALEANRVVANDTRLSSFKSSPQYQWLLNREPIKGSDQRSIEVGQEGIYEVLTYNDDCNRISEPYQLEVTGLDEAILKSVNISPNPTMGIVVVRSTEAPESIQFLSLSGEILIDASNRNKAMMLEYDLSHLKEGLYFIRIKFKQEIITKKLIINR